MRGASATTSSAWRRRFRPVLRSRSRAARTSRRWPRSSGWGCNGATAHSLDRSPAMITSWKAALSMLVAAGFAASAAMADPETLSASLCGVLKAVAPKTRGLEPEAARAQLVRAVAAAFDYDAARLREVKAHIDQATSGSCPEERQTVLANTKAKTLTEAIE